MKKQREHKLWNEFKVFISKGSVLDLAVGMIIGAAFTAIVTAMVNNIFKPLINAIPMENINGLITMLVPRDSNGIQVAMDSPAIDLAKSVYIDWGSFIMAILNFFLTALVLFFMIKGINMLKGGLNKTKDLIEKFEEESKHTQTEEVVAENVEEVIETAEIIPEPPASSDKTQQLLEEILNELKAQRKSE